MSPTSRGRIVFATKAAFAPLQQHHPAVDAVVAQGRDTSTRALAAQLREHAPDVVLDLHGRIHSRALAWMLGAHRLVTWRKRPLADTLLVKTRVRPYRAKMHIAARYHLAVEELVEADIDTSAEARILEAFPGAEEVG